VDIAGFLSITTDRNIFRSGPGKIAGPLQTGVFALSASEDLSTNGTDRHGGAFLSLLMAFARTFPCSFAAARTHLLAPPDRNWTKLDEL